MKILISDTGSYIRESTSDLAKARADLIGTPFLLVD